MFPDDWPTIRKQERLFAKQGKDFLDTIQLGYNTEQDADEPFEIQMKDLGD